MGHLYLTETVLHVEWVRTAVSPMVTIRVATKSVKTLFPFIVLLGAFTREMARLFALVAILAGTVSMAKKVVVLLKRI